MVGTNAVAVQVMPDSPDTNLEEIKVKIKEKLTKSTNIQIEERDIAFGLKSLNLIVAWPDTEETEEIESIISGIDGVSSCKIEEVRRAFG